MGNRKQRVETYLDHGRVEQIEDLVEAGEVESKSSYIRGLITEDLDERSD